MAISSLNFRWEAKGGGISESIPRALTCYRSKRNRVFHLQMAR